MFKRIKTMFRRIRGSQNGEFTPLTPRWLGNRYGGALVIEELLRPGGVVYSVGVGEDISFDQQLHDLIAASGVPTIVGIDPTPRSQTYIENHPQPPPGYEFLAAGLASTNGVQRFYFPENPDHVSMSLVDDAGAGYIEAEFLTLDEIMRRQGHDFVDFLKIDIEGEEYNLLRSWIQQKYSPPVGQIGVEFHPQRTQFGTADMSEIVAGLAPLGFLPIFDGCDCVVLVNYNALPGVTMPVFHEGRMHLGLLPTPSSNAQRAA